MSRYLSRENEAIVQNLKKGKLKTKKLLNITIVDEQEPSVPSADRVKAVQTWSWSLPKPGR